MNRYTILRNARTTYYEVHVAGCKHQIARHMEHMVDQEATSGAALAADSAASNDGCLYRLGPCAKAADEARKS
jgi:hypothetical protein